MVGEGLRADGLHHRFIGAIAKHVAHGADAHLRGLLKDRGDVETPLATSDEGELDAIVGAQDSRV